MNTELMKQNNEILVEQLTNIVKKCLKRYLTES
jgi:hypothetical protein